MFKSISHRRQPRIFEFKRRSNVDVILFIITLFIFSTSPTFAANSNRSTVSTRVGEMFTVEQPRESTFLRWNATGFERRLIRLRRTSLADTVGKDRFEFEALEKGSTQIRLQLIKSTVFGENQIDTRTVNVNIQSAEAPVGPGVNESENAEDAPTVPDTIARKIREDQDSLQSPGSGNSTSRQENSQPGETLLESLEESPEWQRVQDLIDRGQFPAARNIINQQIEESEGVRRRKWKDLLARSFQEQGQFQQAARTWQELIDTFPKGPVPEWRLSMARAYRRAGSNDQAELALLELRHRNQDAPQWVDAMVELGELAIERGNYERARTILENARGPLQGRNNPRLLLQLARIYDRYRPVRDYERAVRLYRRASSALEGKDQSSAETARKRAQYLEENYVNFGFN